MVSLDAVAQPSSSISPRCPVCGADADRVLWSVGSAEAAQHFVLSEADPVRHERLTACIRRLWRGETCDVVECAKCGFGFAHPFVAGDAEFYELAYARPGYPKDRWEYQRTLQALARNFEQRIDASVLEIGAGVGNFLARLPVAPENVVAAEYSPGGRAALAAAGYAVYAGDIREAKFRQTYQGRFGLVFLFQVMEHLDDLDGLFDCLKLVTKPGARIFISVPDIRHTQWTENHGGLLDMPPNHTSRWTPPSLLALARRMRLEVVDIDSRPWRPRDFVAADTYSAYARRMQHAGSIPNRLHRLPRGILRLALEGLAAACFALSRLRYWPAVGKERRGDTLWLELKR